MKHKCVRCNMIYDEGDYALLKGCGCGSKVFVLFSDEQAKEVEEMDIEWIEKELLGLVERTNMPLTLDVENVKILEQGVFELNIQSLIKNPVVVKDQHGVYYIKIKK